MITSYQHGWFLRVVLDGETLYWWSGYGDQVLDGQTYSGLGRRWLKPGRVKTTAELKSNKITLTFDGTGQLDETDFMGGLLSAGWRNAPVQLRRRKWLTGETPDDGSDVFSQFGQIRSLSAPLQAGAQAEISMEIASGALVYNERRAVLMSDESQKEAFPGDRGMELARTMAGRSVIWNNKHKREGKTQKDWPDGDPPPRIWAIGDFATSGRFVAHFSIQHQLKNYVSVWNIADHRISGLNQVLSLIHI